MKKCLELCEEYQRATAEREKLIEEIEVQQSQRDKFREERDAIKQKLNLLMYAIGTRWSTTDLAIKAIERDRADLNRYKVAIQRAIALHDTGKDGEFNFDYVNGWHFAADFLKKSLK